MTNRRQQILVLVLQFFLMSLGAVLGAVSFLVFLAPFNVTPTGATGFAVLLNHFVQTPIGLMTLVLNIPIQLVALRMLPGGWKTIAKTVYVLVVYSFALDGLNGRLPVNGLSDDALLSALFGGIMGGTAGGLVFRSGGSFGGTSTLALILQRRLGTPMSSTFLYLEVTVIGLAAITFGWEPALYAAVVLFVGGLATDYVMEGPSVIRTAVIITSKPEAVADAILHQLERGVTGWASQGMYTGQERWMLYATVSRPQVRDLRVLVSKVDPNAFLVIGQGHVAYGQGFRRMYPISEPVPTLSIENAVTPTDIDPGFAKLA